MFYTVGEIAKKLGIPASTLRYYDKEGLLPFVERSGSGIRMFKDNALEWLSVIGCLKKTGMPIKGIKKFVDWCMEGDATIAQRLELIDRQRDEVLSQLAKLNETLDILNYKHWYYETAKAAGTCGIHNTLPESEIPPEILEIRKKLKSSTGK